jgi:hypothetical protein
VFVASRSTRRAAISARHTWLMTVSALSRKYNIFNCYVVFSRHRRALRTETVICDTNDFGIGRRVCAENWYALRAVGESANRRLCDAEAADAQPAPDVVTFCQVTRPSVTDDGLPQDFASVKRG